MVFSTKDIEPFSAFEKKGWEGAADASHDIIDLYRRHARAWVERRGTQLSERKWLDRFLSLLPEEPSVLDVGCGFGEPIGRFLVNAGCVVTGVDASPELIETARARVPGASWIVADMRRLEMGARYHGIIAWNSTFHLTPDDQRRMFPVFRKHAGRGAVLMFTSGHTDGEILGEFEGEPLYHSSLDAEEYRTLLDRYGFEVVDHVVEDPDCARQTVWLARVRESG